MGDRHLSIIRVAAVAAATVWMYSASAQTIAAIAPVTLAPNPNDPSAISSSTGDKIAVPEDPVKAAAFNVLDQHCARCHQTGKLVGRSKPAKGISNILDLEAIAANPKYVRPGDPDRSTLYHTIIRREMPYDVFQDGDLDHPVPEDKDLKALRSWISALDPKRVSGVQVASLPNADERIPAVSPPHESVQPRLPSIPAADPNGKSASAGGTAPGTATASIPSSPAQPSTGAKNDIIASREDENADSDEAHELIISAQKNLKRLGCYQGDLTGAVDDSLNAAIAHYNGIMGRGAQTAAITSDIIEEMRSNSGNICSTRPVLPVSAPAEEPDDESAAPSHPRSVITENPDPSRHHSTPVHAHVAHTPEKPIERKPAPSHRVAQGLRGPSYAHGSSHGGGGGGHFAGGGGGFGGGGGGGGGGGASTVSSVNGI